MLLSLIYGAGYRKEDSGLKMLPEPIWFWLVASQHYKKDKGLNGSCLPSSLADGNVG